MSISSPNGSAGAAPDGPTTADRKLARIAGIFFIVTFISIAALPLYHSVLNNHSFVVGGTGDTLVSLGAVAEIITLIAGIGTAVALYPLLRRQSEGLARGYVIVRVVESSLIAVGIVSLLAVVTLRQDLAGVGGTDNASLILNGRSLVAIHDATFLLGPAFCAAIGNGLILGYLMLRSGLVPRRFAQFGIAAGSLALVTAILVLFGAYDQVSGPSGILTLPEAVWEFSLGAYLITKGVRADASVFRQTRGSTRPETMPVPAVVAG
jgi:ABC-type transport system involved in cytochrome c biogenesis permease subunit